MATAKRKIAILGSTGSIGQNSIAVIRAHPEEFELISVSGHGNWQELAEQARLFDLKQVVITDETQADNLRNALRNSATEVLAGPEHLIDLARDPNCDTLIVSVVGAAGLPAVLAAVQAGKRIAIANKESLVVAGCILMPMAKECGATILPIDSEHSAILQAMLAGRREDIAKIIITASGGPFRNATAEQIANATLEDALNHPTWSMGPKISIDSATMMNKALEIIEARWLYDLPVDMIEVLVHPESIIHSMVEYADGSVIAQMSLPDMKLPIQYALTYPRRIPCPTTRLDLGRLGKLTFQPPDFERFPAIRLGFEVARKGGTAGATLNAANEAAVEAFRQRKISFSQITKLTEICIHHHNWTAHPTLSQLYEADSWARQFVNGAISK